MEKWGRVFFQIGEFESPWLSSAVIPSAVGCQDHGEGLERGSQWQNLEVQFPDGEHTSSRANLPPRVGQGLIV